MAEKLYIEKIDVFAFGGISGRSFSFTEGINLIKAPNEGGKSTLLAAVFFALYGFNSLSHSITENPKRKYMPWSGAAASVCLTVGGSKKLRIERSHNGSKETALCTEVGTGLHLYSGKVFGEEIFGISAETAERCLFFDTVEPIPAKDEPLAAALQNLLFSADESLSCEKALKTLNAHRKALKTKVKEAEDEATALSLELKKEMDALVEYREALREAKSIEEALEKKELDCEKAEAERENFRKYQAYLLTEEHRVLGERASEAEAVVGAFGKSFLCTEYINRHRSLNAEVDGHRLKVKELSDKISAVSAEDKENIALGRVAAKCASKERTCLLFLLLTLAFLGGAAACCFLVGLMPAVICGAVAILCAASALAMSISRSGTAKKAGFASPSELKTLAKNLPARHNELMLRKNELSAVLEREKAAFTAKSDALEKMNAYADSDAMLADLVELSKLRAKKEETALSLSEFEEKHDLAALRAASEGSVKPQKSETQIETEYRFAFQGAKLLREKLGPVVARIEAFKMAKIDPAITKAKLLQKEKELEVAKKSLSAAVCAIDELTAASTEMKASVSPRIAAIAAKHFQTATEGKYKGLELDASLYMSYDSENGVKSAEHLSAGTRDLAYLCMRLALIELIYGDTAVPIILDDAFCRQDEKRLKALLKVLAHSGHQLIITSCTNREKNAAEALGFAYETVNL